MKVLAVGCHPDDLEIACSGTLRKYVEQGAEVYMCHVANGCLGHVIIEPEELRVIRTKEAENAGAIIGAKEVINLDVPDLEVHSHNFEVMDAMADVVRMVRPDVMITHNPDDYMLDHTETSVIATNGAFCSGLNHRPRKYEAFNSFIPTFFMDTLAGVNFNPTEYVDVSDSIDTKLEMLECHETQVVWMREHDGIDFPDMVKTCCRYRGFQCGAEYAEAFRMCQVYLKGTTKRLLP